MTAHTCQAPGCQRPLPPKRRRYCSDRCQARSQHSPVSPYLLRHIPRVVNDPKWCGGLTRAELAAALGGPGRESEKAFWLSMLVCFRRGQVDLWGDYVLAVVQEPAPRDRKEHL